MDMPEGWKTLNESIKSKQAEWDGAQGGPGSIPFSVSYLVDVRDLIKEMAEALEETINDLGGAASSDAKEALKKFKEWK